MQWLDHGTWTLYQSVFVFVACAAAIGVFGTLVTRIIDQLADRRGRGEAISGAVLLGASTSLAGSVFSVSAAWIGAAAVGVALLLMRPLL